MSMKAFTNRLENEYIERNEYTKMLSTALLLVRWKLEYLLQTYFNATLEKNNSRNFEP